MRAAGFDPAGAIRMLQRLGEFDRSPDPLGLASYLSTTHPPVEPLENGSGIGALGSPVRDQISFGCPQLFFEVTAKTLVQRRSTLPAVAGRASHFFRIEFGDLFRKSELGYVRSISTSFQESPSSISSLSGTTEPALMVPLARSLRPMWSAISGAGITNV